MAKKHIDPEIERWEKKYPRFPGVQKCVELLGSSNVKGTWIEIICVELEVFSRKDPTELIDAIYASDDQRVRFILLNILENSAPEEAVPILGEMIYSGDEEDRFHAVGALKRIGSKDGIGSKEARTILFHAGET
jgi:hypothetical protein